MISFGLFRFFGFSGNDLLSGLPSPGPARRLHSPKNIGLETRKNQKNPKKQKNLKKSQKLSHCHFASLYLVTPYILTPCLCIISFLNT